jgi:hypothetical protein
LCLSTPLPYLPEARHDLREERCGLLARGRPVRGADSEDAESTPIRPDQGLKVELAFRRPNEAGSATIRGDHERIPPTSGRRERVGYQSQGKAVNRDVADDREPVVDGSALGPRNERRQVRTGRGSGRIECEWKAINRCITCARRGPRIRFAASAEHGQEPAHADDRTRSGRPGEQPPGIRPRRRAPGPPRPPTSVN